MTKPRAYLFIVIPALVLWAGVMFCAVRGCRPDYGVAVGKEPNAIRILSSHHTVTIKGCTFAIEPNVEPDHIVILTGEAEFTIKPEPNAIDLNSDLPVDSSTRPGDFTDYASCVPVVGLRTLHISTPDGSVEFQEIPEPNAYMPSHLRLTRIDDGVIRQLASSGRICKVLGHPWKETTMSTASVPSYPVLHCQICGIDVAENLLALVESLTERQ